MALRDSLITRAYKSDTEVWGEMAEVKFRASQA